MTLRGDTRGQSLQVGFILLLGMAMITFSIYQASVIPSHNEKVEFSHSNDVQNDMIDLRNEILDSKQTGQRGYAEVKLGTQYPSRIIGINPPPPAGTIQTGAPEDILVSADGAVPKLCPTGGNIQTRNLTFTDGYNEYQSGPEIVYENTVLYLKYESTTVLVTDEVLVRGSSVNIPPLNTSFSKSGVKAVSVEPIPGNRKTAKLENAEISLPTGLSEAKWESLLAEDDIDPGDITVENGRLNLSTSGKFAVACSPTGLNEAPPGGQRQSAALGINPAGPNDIEVRSFNRPSNNVSEVTFNNTGDTNANVTEARLSFYHNPQDTGGDIGPINMKDQGTTVASLEVLGSLETLDPVIEFTANDDSTIAFENTGGEKLGQDDFFVVRFVYDNGKEGTYFIDVPAK